jgi:hypothetical protein
MGEYGRMVLARDGGSKNMAEQTIHSRLAKNADVASAISVGNGRYLRLIRTLPTEIALSVRPFIWPKCVEFKPAMQQAAKTFDAV